MGKKMGMVAMLGLSAAFAGNVYAAAGDTIPKVTGLTVTDGTGKTYNIDSLLNLNKVIAFNQTFDG